MHDVSIACGTDHRYITSLSIPSEGNQRIRTPRCIRVGINLNKMGVATCSIIDPVLGQSSYRSFKGS